MKGKGNHGGGKGKGKGEPEPFEKLTDLLWDFVLVAGIAAGVAAMAALVLRLAGCRWDWSLAGLLPTGVLVAVDPVIAAGTGAATIGSGAIGFAWHRRDLDLGGTEAQRARQRPGPARALAAAIGRRRAHAEPISDDRLTIGQTPSGRVRTIPIGKFHGVRGFLPGAPNSGKTVTMAAIALAYIRLGLPVVAIDPKGDRWLRQALESAARKAGRRFLAWSPDGRTVYNPVRRGDPSEIVDKALAGEQWTEPHYLRQAQRFLGHALRIMRAIGEWPPSLGRLARYLEPEHLEAAASELGNEAGEETILYLQSLSPRSKSDLGGVRDRLAVLAESGLGQWLEPQGGADEIDLAEAMARGDVVYMELDADRFQLAATMLGAAVIVDLVSLTAHMQRRDHRGLVLIDEFSAIESELIARLLSRSRSAGLSVLLATQTMADLDVARPDDPSQSLRKQVLSQVDFVIAHRQSEPEAAEFLASYAGTRPEWTVTQRVERVGGFAWHQPTNNETRTRGRGFVQHPDVFKGLGTGWGIVIEPASKREAELVRIWMPEES